MLKTWDGDIVWSRTYDFFYAQNAIFSQYFHRSLRSRLIEVKSWIRNWIKPIFLTNLSLVRTANMATKDLRTRQFTVQGDELVHVQPFAAVSL